MKVLHTCGMLSIGFLALVGCGPSTTTGPKDAHDTSTDKTPATSGGDVAVGKAAPEITAEFISGNGPKTLGEAKGTVVILDFWGTFCEPCKKSFPKLQELSDTQAGKLSIIAVSKDDPEDKKPEDLKKFGQDFNVNFPLVWDKAGKTAAIYKPAKMPTSFVIDKKGVVRFIHEGYHEDEAAALAKEVDSLVAE